MNPAVFTAGGTHPGWPAKLGPLPTVSGAVAGRPMRRGDFADWQGARLRDEALIKRWDASSELTWEQRHSRAMWHSHRSVLRVGARRGEVVPFAVTVDGAFAGQATLGGVQRGALRSAWVGYWVDSRFHGKGVATAAVALLVAHAFGPVGLHRVEATISPQNVASRAVMDHLGFRPEGELLRYLDIDGAWRDHLLYALTIEELPGGLAQLLDRWRASGSGSAPPPPCPR